jgi:hypothetical protein
MTGKSDLNSAILFLCCVLGAAGVFSCQGSVTAGDAADDADGRDDGPADADTADIDADADVDGENPPPGCGNGVVDPGEACEASVSPARDCTTTCGSGGSQSCTAACTWGACEPPEETCNGEDDDCDGSPDNGFECVLGETGTCFPYCGEEVRRSCAGDCTWGECEVPAGSCDEIVVPYMDDPVPSKHTMAFDTGIRAMDVYFLVDTTGSMWEEIDVLRASFTTTVAAGLTLLVPDLQLGVGHFDDYPIEPFGGEGDETYENLLSLTPSVSAAQAAVDALPDGWGSDYPESNVVALWTVATGDPTPTSPLQPSPACAAGLFGYPCFRTGALPVIVLISDAEFHNGPGGQDPYTADLAAPTFERTVEALVAAHMQVISVRSQSTTGTDADYIALAQGTGSVDNAGSPLVFNVDSHGAELGERVVTGAQVLVGSVPMDVGVAARDDPADGLDAALLIESITPNTVDAVEDPRPPGGTCVMGLPTADTDGDGSQDTFAGVLPGIKVCFDITARNTIAPPDGEAHFYRVFIGIIGDGVALLDMRELTLIVPP